MTTALIIGGALLLILALVGIGIWLARRQGRTEAERDAAAAREQARVDAERKMDDARKDYRDAAGGDLVERLRKHEF